MAKKEKLLNIENAKKILKSGVFDNNCSYDGAVLFVSKAFEIPMDTLLESLDKMLIFDYSNEEINAMKKIHCKEKWSKKEEEIIERIGLDVGNNDAGMWNEVMVRQGFDFEEKYPQIAEGIYDYALADMVYNYPDSGMLPPIKRIIENRNDVAVFEIDKK